MYDYLSESGELRQAELPCSCLVVLGEARKGGLPTGQGGMGRRVYTKNHVFRTQKEKGNYGKGGEQNLSGGIAWLLDHPIRPRQHRLRPNCYYAL